MRIAVVGLGIQGKKRIAIAGDEVFARVDTQAEADYQTIDQVPLSSYDAALVCTPDKPKIDILRYLLSHGKHVLVEKPLLAEDETELGELRDLSRANNVACYTAYNHRFEPHFVRMKETIATRVLGDLYLARVFYGNGTAMDVHRSPWRDRGVGVLSDIGSHLLDTMLFLFGDVAPDFEVWSDDSFENSASDHVLFGLRGRPVIELEATLVSWRNTFTFDVYGEKGSAHIDCLCKWGPSTYRLRKRVLPSGRPSEEVETLEMPDPTWALEYDYFKKLCQRGGSNVENDIWINRVLKQLAHAVNKELF
jgi:predicted dehydrogenase